jgi:hypothetical protein
MHISLRTLTFFRNLGIATVLGISLGWFLIGAEVSINRLFRYANHYTLEEHLAGPTNSERESVLDELFRLIEAEEPVEMPRVRWFNDPSTAPDKCRDGLFADMGAGAGPHKERFYCIMR